MFSDLRQACRALGRMPVVSAVVTSSLALGIGANTVVFSWIQARVLEPIPGVAQGAAVQLVEARTDAGLYNGSSWLEYQDLRENVRSFEDAFAARMVPLYVGEAGAVERVFGLLVSDNYFRALGLPPARGQFPLPGEAASGEGVVISHRLWQSHFAGADDVTRRTVRINQRDWPVAAVTPAAFQGTVVGLQFDAWVPAEKAPLVASGSRELEDRAVRGYSVMGRLKPSVSRPQAQAEVDGVMRRLAETHPATNTKVTAEVMPFASSPRGPQRLFNSALYVLQGIMFVLLLAVCGNVANLLLARAGARQKEMAIRLALGAAPWRVARLLLAENLVLALLGAGAGAGLAVWGTKALMLLPTATGLPLRFQSQVDALGLAFAVVLGLVASLLCGAAPALHLARVEGTVASRAATGGSHPTRVRRVLMGAQVALATVVLIAAGMFLQGFLETKTTDPGFRRGGVMLATYDLSGRSVEAGYPRALAARTLDLLAALPGVEGVAVATSVPLDIHGLPSRVFTLEGRTRETDGDDETLTNIVSPGYFAVMGIGLTSGRDFSPLLDAAAPREAVVNEAFVARYLAGGEPLGRTLRARGGLYTIVGVARTTLANAFGEPPTPLVYFSYKDNPQPRGEIHLRSKEVAEKELAAGLRGAMRALDPELPVFNLRSMAQQIDANLIFRKIPARMFSVLGPLLLLLAALGIYAVVAYAVSLRTREIGVRLALGATAGRVVRQFVGESLRVALVGSVLGWTVALALALRLAPPGRVGAPVFGLVPLLLLAVAALACWIPARRIARVDAAVALRTE